MIEDTIYNAYLHGAKSSTNRLVMDARQISEDAMSLTFYIGKLPYRYPFMTNAEAAMAQAENALTESLARLQAARARYAEMPAKLPTTVISLDAAE